MKNIEKLDTVTGLPIYDSFIGIAREELANNFVPGHYVLIATDISNFKYINHIYGYSKANELLRDLIALISNSVDGNVSTCRTHSDHIISLFKYNGDKTAFCSRVDRYSRDFVKDNNRKYPSIMLHLNNGILFIDKYNDDLIYCIDKANVARRRAKGNYCVSSVIFSDGMMDKEEEDAKILAVFDTAIKNGNIRTFYQPKINIRTHEINGAEVLSRIYDSNGKMLYPDTYIPVLENSGKVVELDRYVMREAFASVRKWIDMGWKVVPVSINLSRMHFYESNVADNIYNEFRRYNIPVEYVELELTESLFFADSDTIIREISKLRNYGFKVSMDDFGVGYSTLNTLGTLPVDIIKFDKGFISNSMNNEAVYQILQSLIHVFRQINYDVICEGIETKEQEKLIFECGCDNVQGFLYDKPLERDIFEDKYLKKQPIQCLEG